MVQGSQHKLRHTVRVAPLRLKKGLKDHHAPPWRDESHAKEEQVEQVQYQLSKLLADDEVKGINHPRLIFELPAQHRNCRSSIIATVERNFKLALSCGGRKISSFERDSQDDDGVIFSAGDTLELHEDLRCPWQLLDFFFDRRVLEVPSQYQVEPAACLCGRTRNDVGKFDVFVVDERQRQHAHGYIRGHVSKTTRELYPEIAPESA
mmetsp:Transcript_25019/g.34283  ORF Transcript_25019/g.34283 Transcript_25019/m.34283 type:complete len:207 (-) Transcript_25019:999-1619(-)